MAELKLETGWLRRDVVEAAQQTGNWQLSKISSSRQGNNKTADQNQNHNDSSERNASK